MPVKNKRWKNLITLITAFFALVILFDIFPRCSDLAGNTYTLIEQKATISNADEIETKYEEVKAEERKLLSVINSIVSEYTENQKVSDILKEFNEYAKETKVNITSIKSGELIKNDNLWLQPIELKVESTYEGYYNFIKFIENSPKVITIKETKFSADKTGEPKLNITSKIEVYLNI